MAVKSEVFVRAWDLRTGDIIVLKDVKSGDRFYRRVTQVSMDRARTKATVENESDLVAHRDGHHDKLGPLVFGPNGRNGVEIYEVNGKEVHSRAIILLGRLEA